VINTVALHAMASWNPSPGSGGRLLTEPAF
jgi:hypothetical protein